MTPEMLLIPAGDICLRDEGTKTNWTVRVQPFLLASVPVTRELYLAVTGEVPSSAAGPRTPVTEVSWIDSVAFCNRLSLGEGRRPYSNPAFAPTSTSFQTSTRTRIAVAPQERQGGLASMHWAFSPR